MDHYELLGLRRNASDKEISEAFRRLAIQHHPDKNSGSPKSALKFKEIVAAYEILSDPIKRGQYDTKSFRPVSKPNVYKTDFDSTAIFHSLFGESVGKHIQVNIEIELKEVRTGCQKEIEYQIRSVCRACLGKGYGELIFCRVCNGAGCGECQQTGCDKKSICSTCYGSGFGEYQTLKKLVSIPAGINNGMQVCLRGSGEQSRKAGRPGNLNIFVNIKEHPLYQRDGNDLILNVPLSYTQLVLGGDLEIITLEKEKITVTVPPGIQSGTKFRLKKRGLPDYYHPGDTGDLIVSVKIETATVETDEYRELINRLAKLEEQHLGMFRQEYFNKKEII